MRYLVAVSAMSAIILFAALALANPALLPKHPGYPGEASKSPVTGQALGNDAGAQNQFGEVALREAAASEDAHITQDFRRQEQESRVLESQGAGRLPKVEGPEIKIEPPVKEGTRMK
jgi:hypothetical protein